MKRIACSFFRSLCQYCGDIFQLIILLYTRGLPSLHFGSPLIDTSYTDRHVFVRERLLINNGPFMFSCTSVLLSSILGCMETECKVRNCISSVSQSHPKLTMIPLSFSKSLEIFVLFLKNIFALGEKTCNSCNKTGPDQWMKQIIIKTRCQSIIIDTN